MRIGIIGFGGAGQAHYFYFSCVAGCRVTKIFDPKPAAAERAAARAAAATFCSDEDRFWPDLDAVVVCTPDATHAAYMVEGARARTARAGREAADRFGRGAVRDPARGGGGAGAGRRRRAPDAFRAAAPADQGARRRPDALGALSYLEGYYVHDLTTRAFQNDRWRDTDNATPLVYSGCHFVDLLRWFAGEEIVEVFAAAEPRRVS